MVKLVRDLVEIQSITAETNRARTDDQDLSPFGMESSGRFDQSRQSRESELAMLGRDDSSADLQYDTSGLLDGLSARGLFGLQRNFSIGRTLSPGVDIQQFPWTWRRRFSCG